MKDFTTNLFILFDRIRPLSPALRKAIKKRLREKTIRKGDFLLKTGEISRTIYFIGEGLVRSFHYAKDMEITNWIMKENDIIISIASFFYQEPCVETIEALEDSTLYWITYEELADLCRMYPEFNLHQSNILWRYYAESEKRHFMRTRPSLDRYLYLLDQYPTLVDRVQGQHLASFLSMSKYTLSKQRTKYHRKSKK